MAEPRRLSDDQVRRLRVRAQRLCGERPTSVAGVLGSVFALQAQDTKAARLGLRARSDGLDLDGVRRACNLERSAVRTWAMRGTLHMLPAEDAAWLIGLLGPRLAVTNRGRRLQVGLDDDFSEKAIQAIREILAAHGPQTRADLVRALAARGLRLKTNINAAAHLLFFAAVRGLILRGPDRGDQPEYVLLEDWVPRQRPRTEEAAIAELAARYLRAYGPATVQDFATWGGISVGWARRGFEAIRARLTEVLVSGKPAWTLEAPELDWCGPAEGQSACVRLTGAFDTYLLGYRGRELALPSRHAQRVVQGGMFLPAVMADGRVIAAWRQITSRDGVVVAVAPFDGLDRGTIRAMELETVDVGRFLGVKASLEIEKSSQ